MYNQHQPNVRPSLHLPRAPCDKFVYDFPYDFWGIVGGYGLRRMCLHYIRVSCDFCTDSGGLIGTNPYGGCAEIVRKSYNFSAVTVQSPQAFNGNRTEPVRLPCRGCTEIRWRQSWCLEILRVSLFTISRNMCEIPISLVIYINQLTRHLKIHTNYRLNL